MKKSLIEFLALTILFGIDGALIGYGFSGDVQTACLCAGVGFLWLPILFFVVLVLGAM